MHMMSPREREQDRLLPKNDSFVSVDTLQTSISSSTSSVEELVDDNNNNNKKSVSFGCVEIRLYNRIVGDHPDVRVGPPVTFSWEYGQEIIRKPLDQYEDERPSKKLNLRMSSITRKNILLNVFGISEDEIRNAEKEIQKIKKQREHTYKQGKSVAVVESVFKRAGRKIRKNIIKSLTASHHMMGPTIMMQA